MANILITAYFHEESIDNNFTIGIYRILLPHLADILIPIAYYFGIEDYSSDRADIHIYMSILIANIMVCFASRLTYTCYSLQI